jgi:predicted PurR-regulated permease PerM
MNGDLTSIFGPLKSFFAKHHPVIVISAILLLLALAIFLLYSLLAVANSTETNAPSTIQNFDKQTIDKIKQLHDSGDTPEPIVFPSPRVNPFNE